MNKLIYCSFAVLNQVNQPLWVKSIQDYSNLNKQPWAFYNPWLSLQEHDKSIVECLRRNVKTEFQNYQSAYKLEDSLFKSIETQEVQSKLAISETEPSLNLVFKSLYILLRSDIMLVDLNIPTYGENSQEVNMAWLGNIPVIGITNRFVLSPWILGKTQAIVPYADETDVNKIAKQLTNFNKEI